MKVGPVPEEGMIDMHCNHQSTRSTASCRLNMQSNYQPATWVRTGCPWESAGFDWLAGLQAYARQQCGCQEEAAEDNLTCDECRRVVRYLMYLVYLLSRQNGQ